MAKSVVFFLLFYLICYFLTFFIQPFRLLICNENKDLAASAFYQNLNADDDLSTSLNQTNSNIEPIKNTCKTAVYIWSIIKIIYSFDALINRIKSFSLYLQCNKLHIFLISRPNRLIIIYKTLFETIVITSSTDFQMLGILHRPIPFGWIGLTDHVDLVFCQNFESVKRADVYYFWLSTWILING